MPRLAAPIPDHHRRHGVPWPSSDGAGTRPRAPGDRVRAAWCRGPSGPRRCHRGRRSIRGRRAGQGLQGARYARPPDWHSTAQPRQGAAVSRRRSRIDPRGRDRRRAGAPRAHRLCQRGAPCARDARLHRGTPGRRGTGPTGIPATILRPWYVLGPGHRWPYALVPLYWLFERLPSTRESARRLGLVTRPQMVAALMMAIERGPDGAGIVEVSAIRDAKPLRTEGLRETAKVAASGA